MGVFGEISLSPLMFAVIIFVAQVVSACFFAWLIAYQQRCCSPSRFFLEGLLFPRYRRNTHEHFIFA